MSAVVICQPDPLPTYFEVFTTIGDSITEMMVAHLRNSTSKSSGAMDNMGGFSSQDMLNIVYATITWYFARKVFTNSISTPIARWARLHSKSKDRFIENFWNLFTHIFLSSWMTYSVFYSTGPCSVFYKPSLSWEVSEYNPSKPIPQIDVYWLTITDIGFYLFGIYSLLRLEEKKKDSSVLLFHHLLTISLISWGYMVRQWKLSIFIMFLHETCDVFLDATRVFTYLKHNMNGLMYHIFDKLSLVMAIVFPISWIVLRLYYYPLKVLYWSFQCPLEARLLWPITCGIFALLVILALDIYWFWLIIKYLIKLAIGEGLVDTTLSEAQQKEGRKQN